MKVFTSSVKIGVLCAIMLCAIVSVNAQQSDKAQVQKQIEQMEQKLVVLESTGEGTEIEKAFLQSQIEYYKERVANMNDSADEIPVIDNKPKVVVKVSKEDAQTLDAKSLDSKISAYKAEIEKLKLEGNNEALIQQYEIAIANLESAK